MTTYTNDRVNKNQSYSDENNNKSTLAMKISEVIDEFTDRIAVSIDKLYKNRHGDIATAVIKTLDGHNIIYNQYKDFDEISTNNHMCNLKESATNSVNGTEYNQAINVKNNDLTDEIYCKNNCMIPQVDETQDLNRQQIEDETMKIGESLDLSDISINNNLYSKNHEELLEFIIKNETNINEFLKELYTDNLDDSLENEDITLYSDISDVSIDEYLNDSFVQNIVTEKSTLITKQEDINFNDAKKLYKFCNTTISNKSKDDGDISLFYEDISRDFGEEFIVTEISTQSSIQDESNSNDKREQYEEIITKYDVEINENDHEEESSIEENFDIDNLNISLNENDTILIDNDFTCHKINDIDNLYTSFNEDDSIFNDNDAFTRRIKIINDVKLYSIFESAMSLIQDIKDDLFDLEPYDDDVEVDFEMECDGSETGFVETLTPQYTPGQSITSPQPTPSAVEEKLANLQAQQEMAALKHEIQDLKEKLETLKIKRTEDRDKLRELERLRLQVEQAGEFKSRIMESQAQLQRDLQRAKQELREAQESLEAHNDETADLQEAAEMAALDKEMAEERAEALTLELETCREKLEEATLDLQLMKAELEAAGNTAGDGGGGGGYELRQMEQQNVRLRETLVRLRDLSAHDKHEMQKMQKDLDQTRSEVAELSRSKEKLASRVDDLEAQVADLQEQVDAALGAEEMLEHLASKKMALEDQVERLRQDVTELEALQEVHEQLVESARELELDLRDELELAHAATREAIREREAALETIMDRDATIAKFRELVQKMTDQYSELRSQHDNKSDESLGSQTNAPACSVGGEVSALVAACRASTRSLDLQLRALDLTQAHRRAKLLAHALPQHYTQPGGDHDAILLILLLERLNTKADIILGQIREKFPAVTHWDKESLLKSHTAVQYSFRCHLEFQLYMIQCYVTLWSEALDRCSPDTLLTAASALPDALQQEKPLDRALQLLKSHELDENSQLDGLERCWSYLSAMWSALAAGAESRAALALVTLAMDALARMVAVDVACSQANAPESDQKAEIIEVHTYLRTSCEHLQTTLKATRRRLPQQVDVVAPPLDTELIISLRTEATSHLHRVARSAALSHRAAAAAAAAAERTDAQTMSHATLLNIWGHAVEKVYQQDDVGAIKTIRHSMTIVLNTVNKLSASAQEHEYDLMSRANQREEKPTPPVILRAEMVRKQLEETKTLAIKLENKEADIKELKKSLKAAKEEVSEMQIRRELAERKLTSAARDAELKAEQLMRKLDDAHNHLKRKEKEFEETMDHLQQDIDSLETERGALRDKLKLFAKRGPGMHAVATPVAVKEITQSASDVKISSGVVIGGEVNDALQHQLKVLSWTVDREREARIAACNRADRAILRNLRPLYNPTVEAAVVRRREAESLQRELLQFQNEWVLFVARSGLVKFPDDLAKYPQALQQHKERQRETRRKFEERLLALQGKVKEQMLKHRPWRCVEADFTQFPSTELAHALASKDVDVGTITYPASPQMNNAEPIYVTPAQLARLKELVEELQSDDVKLDLQPLELTACAN